MKNVFICVTTGYSSIEEGGHLFFPTFTITTDICRTITDAGLGLFATSPNLEAVLESVRNGNRLRVFKKNDFLWNSETQTALLGEVCLTSRKTTKDNCTGTYVLCNRMLNENGDGCRMEIDFDDYENSLNIEQNLVGSMIDGCGVSGFEGRYLRIFSQRRIVLPIT